MSSIFRKSALLPQNGLTVLPYYIFLNKMTRYTTIIKSYYVIMCFLVFCREKNMFSVILNIFHRNWPYLSLFSVWVKNREISEKTRFSFFEGENRFLQYQIVGLSGCVHFSNPVVDGDMYIFHFFMKSIIC